MMMPVLDGPAAIHVLRNINPAVKVVAASGIDAESRVADARAAGAVEFLAKPFTAETLLTTIRDVLNRPATSARSPRPS
jgi:CheY-like chemotaxis protein